MLVKIVVRSEAVAIRAFVAGCYAGSFADQPHPGPLWARLFATANPPLDMDAGTLRRVLDAASDLATLTGGVSLGESYDGGLSHVTCRGTSLRVDGCEITIAGGAESVTRKVTAALAIVSSLGEDEDEGEGEPEGAWDALERRYLPEDATEDAAEDERWLAARYGGEPEDAAEDDGAVEHIRGLIERDLREADTTAPWERW